MSSAALQYGIGAFLVTFLLGICFYQVFRKSLLKSANKEEIMTDGTMIEASPTTTTEVNADKPGVMIVKPMTDTSPAIAKPMMADRMAKLSQVVTAASAKMLPDSTTIAYKV